MVDYFDTMDVEHDFWNLGKQKIQTLSLEKTLEQLVFQVTTLVNSENSSRRKKGRSKRAQILVVAIENATNSFIEKGKRIAFENSNIDLEMLSAIEDVRKIGKTMGLAAREFTEDPCSSLKRCNMIRIARNLLSSVIRLLILADKADVNVLLVSLKNVKDNLQNLTNASNELDLLENINLFCRSTAELLTLAAKRQQELINVQLRDNLAAARAVLRKYSTMLLSVSKVYIRHPELAAAKENRDCVLRQICETINTIGNIVQGEIPFQVNTCDNPRVSLVASDNFETMVGDNEIGSFLSLDEDLMKITNDAELMASSSYFRNEKCEKIILMCKTIRQALQNWEFEYITDRTSLDVIPKFTNSIRKQTTDLSRQFREVVVEYFSDCFLQTRLPLFVLIEAARAGNLKEVEACAVVFKEHADKMLQASNFACSVASNEDGVKMVRHAATHIDNLCLLVINSARILASKYGSKVAQENMKVFCDTWMNHVDVLTEAVDDIIVIDDFLAVYENRILDDVNKCVLSLQKGYADALNEMAGVICDRAKRVCNVVTAEMDNYEPGIYTERVLKATKMFRDKVVPRFAQLVRLSVNALCSNPPKNIDENEFIDASELVCDGVKEIRRAVIMNRSNTELGFGCTENGRYSKKKKDRDVGEYVNLTGIETARETMRTMTEEDRRKIAEQVDNFRSEKLKFDEEISKWGNVGNEIIVLAKRMCVIMTEMTDFISGRGPLKTTLDVTNAAQKISEAGITLDKLTRRIADQCAESSTKNDLLAYLLRIALYCHQLNITSKVIADVQHIRGELIVSGLDSATSLIQSAKNLMNAVILVVKTSYVASTKYPRLS